MTDCAHQLHQYVQSHKDDFLSLLQVLVEQETPSDDPDEFTEFWHILRDQFEAMDFTVEQSKGNTTAGTMLCTPPGFNPDEPIQLIVGHCDTVWPVETLKEMPFQVSGNEVSGPGTYDMKAGLVMMIIAMRAVAHLGKSPQVQPVFLINSDEEIGSDESQDLLVEQARGAKRTIVMEPSLGEGGKIKTERKGIGEFEITVSGKPSHAGLAPDEGVSAILGLSHIVQQLFKLNSPEKGITVNVGTIEGGERANVIAARSKAVVDVRVPTKEDGQRIKEVIYSLKPEIDGIELEISGDIRRPPLEKNEANEKLWKTVEKLGAELGLDLQEGTSGGASDGNLTNLYSPTIDGMGPVGEGAHAYHEKIYLEETLQRTALLALLILQPDH